MPNLMMRSKSKIPDKSRPRISNRVVEELNPSSGWAEDSNNHYILIQLHQFSMEDIKLQNKGPFKLAITGERKEGDNRTICFDKTYIVPEDSNIERAEVKLDQGTLRVTIPRLAVQLPDRKGDQSGTKREGTRSTPDEKEPNANITRAETEEPKEGKTGKAENEQEIDTKSTRNVFFQGIQAVSENKATILTAFIAFMLGFFASRRHGSS